MHDGTKMTLARKVQFFTRIIHLLQHLHPPPVRVSIGAPFLPASFGGNGRLDCR
jgi:hypothetical protein